MRVQECKSTTYLAPTARRRYLTKNAAANAEARAMVREKYPTEPAEYEGGYCVFGGWHWSSDDRLVRVQKRLFRFIRRAMP